MQQSNILHLVMSSSSRQLELVCVTTEVAGEQLQLHPYRGIYWPREDMLLVSDLHLGKVHHFRKSGIFVPSHAAMDNYERLSSLLLRFKPGRLMILGDLFHSGYNHDWKTFSELRQTFAHVSFDLVIGNHDILEKPLFEDNDVGLHDTLHMDPFTLSHFPIESEHYNLAGHLHPGVRLVGESKQSLRLPCFYFGAEQGILPAFGTFTGTSLIRPTRDDQVFVISEDQIAKVGG